MDLKKFDAKLVKLKRDLKIARKAQRKLEVKANAADQLNQRARSAMYEMERRIRITNVAKAAARAAIVAKKRRAEAERQNAIHQAAECERVKHLIVPEAKLAAEIAKAHKNKGTTGPLIVWKKLQGDYIAKLFVPAAAKRNILAGAYAKCRSEIAYVISVEDISGKVIKNRITFSGYHLSQFHYHVKQWAIPDSFDTSERQCAAGIHFYRTRKGAEQHV